MQRESEKAMTRVARMSIDTNYADAQVQRAAAQVERERKHREAEDNRYLRGFERRALADRREADQRLKQEERQALASKREEDRRQREEDRRFKKDSEATRKEYEARPETRAQRRREGERNKALEDAEYKKVYSEGDDENQRKVTYETVRVAHRLRRHVGGLVGGLIGVFADIMYEMQKAENEAQKRERAAKLLREARTPIAGLGTTAPISQQLLQSQTPGQQIQTSIAQPTMAQPASVLRPATVSPPFVTSTSSATSLPVTQAAATIAIAQSAATPGSPLSSTPAVVQTAPAPTIAATQTVTPAEITSEVREVDPALSARSKKGAETTRKQREKDDKALNSYRRAMAEAIGSPGAIYETAQEGRAREKKERQSELRKARSAKKRAENAPQAAEPIVDLAEIYGPTQPYGPTNAETAEQEEYRKRTIEDESPKDRTKRLTKELAQNREENNLPQHYASGGGVGYPVAQRAEVTTPMSQEQREKLEIFRDRVRGYGAEGKVKFLDPIAKLSNEELLAHYNKNKAVPIPLARGESVSKEFVRDWHMVSRLMPELASQITSVQNYTDEQLDRKKALGKPEPVASVVPKQGVFQIGRHPEELDAATIWHELVHMDQYSRGDLEKAPRRDSTGKLTKYGRLMESEATQRGNIQGAIVLHRLKSLLKGRKLEHHARGGVVPGQEGVPDNADEVDIKATKGEFVINKASAQKYRDVLESINAGYYATGGEVGPTSDLDPITQSLGMGPAIKEHPFEKAADDIRKKGEDEEQDFLEGLKQDEDRKKANREHEQRYATRVEQYHQQNEYGPHQQAVIQPDYYGPYQEVLPDPKRVQGVAENERQKRLESLDVPSTGLSPFTRAIPTAPLVQPKPPYVDKELPGDAGMTGIPGISNIMSIFSKVLPIAGPLIDGIKLLSSAATGAVKTTIGGASGIANWAASADSDPSKTLENMGDAASKAGDAMSNIIPFSGLWVTALGESTKALGTFMQAVDKTAERYAEVSGPIAAQQAMGEIRQVMGDLRRAQEVGPEIVRYMKTQQDIQQKFEDIKVKILTKLLAAINPALEVIDKLLPTLEAVMEGPITALMQPIQAIAEAINSLVVIQRDDRLPTVQDPADILLSRTVAGGFGRTRQQEVGDQGNF